MKSILRSFVFLFVFAGVCSAQSIYFPQVANGIQGNTQWSTAVALTNPAVPGSAAAAGTLTFTQDNGTPLTVSLFDEQSHFLGTGDTFSFQIAGGQTKFYFSNGVGALAQGYATALATVPLTGTAVFFEGVVNGSLISQAGVIPASPLARQGIIAVQDSDVSTAIAVANPGNSTSNITFQLLDTTGAFALPSVSRAVTAHNHTAFFINQLFPNFPAQFFGTLRIITADATPVVATGLLFQSGGQFATLAVFPVQ